MQLESPLLLLLLVPILVVAAALASRRVRPRSAPGLLFAKPKQIAAQRPSARLRIARWSWLLRVLAMILLVVAVARPREGRSDSVVTSEGIDIMMLVDTSSSMAAEDFGGELTRLDHVVDVVRDFVRRRETDRIGIVAFGASAWTRAPLTLDHELIDAVLVDVTTSWHRAYRSLAMKQAQLGRAYAEYATAEERDLQGTAIGDALITAVARLEKSKAKSKVIVLLTDGENTDGVSTPVAGAELAERFGIKVHAVGAGSTGTALVKTYDARGRIDRRLAPVRIDEATLKRVAEIGGGHYFRATDRQGLEEIYRRIDELESSEITSRDYTDWNELFPPLAWAALALLTIEALLAATVLRRVP